MIEIRTPRWACLIGPHYYRYAIRFFGLKQFLICVPGFLLSRNYLV